MAMETRTEVPKKTNWLVAILIGRNPKRTLVRVVVLAVAVYIICTYVALPTWINGGSMMPTYPERGFNFVNRLAYRLSDPQRGDVVAIRMAGPHLMYLKRIVGLPGETVAFHHGKLYVNGKVLDEPYVKYPCDWEMPMEEVGPDQYFVVGDNRSMPIENHRFGRAERRRIVGKVLL